MIDIEPTLLQKLTWQVMLTVHKRAVDGSAAHARLWLDTWGTVGITTSDSLIITPAELQRAAMREAAAKQAAVRAAQEARDEFTR